MYSGRMQSVGGPGRGRRGRPGHPGLLVLWLMLALAGLSAYSCGERGEGGSTALPPEVSAKFGSLTAESVKPYAMTDIEKIKANYLHQQHSVAGLDCAACHAAAGPIAVKDQLALCQQCHDEKDKDFFVSRELWNEHCFACHQFTGDRIHEQNFVPAKDTCLACHTTEEAGEYIYGFYSHNMKSEMACRTCHRPHDNPPVFATDNCASCHGVFFENEFMKSGHVSCSLCHEPHYWKAPADLDCTQCHSAAPGVLVHTLEFHPKNCLACHNPHFQDTEIKGGQCQLCHDSFKGLQFAANLPAAHMNCTNCHSGSTFGFKGVAACNACHSSQVKDLSAEFVPDKHRQCNSCHKPHTWRASFSNTCKQCHDLGSVVEHGIAAHPKNCQACHDPHMATQLPDSGNCNGCHGAGTFPSFSAGQPAPHLDCSNCHTPGSESGHKFEFVGEEDSCQVCHAQAPDNGGTDWDTVPAGHTMCTACHVPHTWKPSFGENSCGICHSAETAAVAGNPLHAECVNCHQAGHTMKFVGKDASCDICHADVVEQGQPMGKDDCFLCHTQHEFKVDDQNTCTVCHTTAPDSGKDWSAIPAGHTTCSGCHKPHGWLPQTTPATCGTCHGDVTKATAGNSMHGECMNCHTAGHEMEFAGHANSCALCHSEINEMMQPMGKDNCSLCHTEHSFRADTSVCATCHTDLFATHNTPGHSECMNCHQVHSFKPDRTTCEICHTDRANHFPEVRDCVRCHIFRRGG